MTVVSGDQWIFTQPVKIIGTVDYRHHDIIRNNLLSVPVGSIVFYTIGRGNGPVSLDGDLIAIANLTGTNTIYYRSADSTWSPVVIGSGLTFIGGILTATGMQGASGASGSGVGPDLTAIEALTSTGIFYRSAADTWSLVNIGSNIQFNTGTLSVTGINGFNGMEIGYCAERDIGLIPWDPQTIVGDTSPALSNRIKLNAAMDAMCPSGNFTFANGTTGAVLKPIYFPGRTYFFQDNLRTSLRHGCTLIGAANSYPHADFEFYPYDSFYGGAGTRFVRTNPSGVDGEFVFLIRNGGCNLQNIGLFGATTFGSQLFDVPATGYIHTVLGMEGRSANSPGQNSILNCTMSLGTHGIRLCKGYYDPTGFVSDENHADTTRWDNLLISNVDTCFKSENIQSLIHNFSSCRFLCNSGGTIIHAERGGIWKFQVAIGGAHLTLLKLGSTGVTNTFSQNSSHFDIDFARDGYGGTDHKMLHLQYAGSGVGTTGMDFNVRFHGIVSNENEVQYFGPVADFNGINSNKIWWDVYNIEFQPIPTGYYWDIVGPWQRLKLSGT